jgi:hypothetical protein
MRYAALVAAVLVLGSVPAGKMPHLTAGSVALMLGLVAWAALLTAVGVMIVRGRE